MQKVFLSHSSKDKALVGAVYEKLGGRLTEYDAKTFEGGLPNWEVIVRAFERCDIFVLFATSNALISSWVHAEIKEARRRMRDRRLKRLLVFVTDGVTVSTLPSGLQDFAVFLTLTKPVPIALAIQRHLLELSAAARRDRDDFVGRDAELSDLKSVLLAPEKKLNGISVSGLPLLGRASLIRRVMNDLHPVMHSTERVVNFHVFESCTDLAIDLYGTVNELISPDKIDEFRQSFTSNDPTSCGRKLFNILQAFGEEEKLYVIFSDRGGIINHRGSFTNIAASLVESAYTKDELRVFFVTTRRPVTAARNRFSNLAFVDLQPMLPAAARQYVVHKAKSRKISLTIDQIDQIVDLGRGLSQNLDFILEKCMQIPPTQALENIEDIFEMTKERSRLLLEGMTFSEDAKLFLAVLNHYFSVPAEFVSTILDSYDRGADACAELLDHHAIIESHGVYTLSPPLVDAISRDRRFNLDSEKEREIARKFATMLYEYREDGVVPVNIIDAASIASIETGTGKDNWASQLILPSHYIYLARRAYNRRQYIKSLDYCESAIARRSALTLAAYIYACRTLGMSAARSGDSNGVQKAVALLNAVSDPLAQASAAYVRGFDYRLSGHFDNAEEQYLVAQQTMRDDAALMRELALVNLLRRDYEKAISYGESALVTAPNSPYVLDIIARSMLSSARSGPNLEYSFEIDDILNKLKRACDDNFHSFYYLRNAERMFLLGRYGDALEAAHQAVGISRELAAPYLLRSRIYLASGDIGRARKDHEAAKSRTQTAPHRHRYFDAEIIRVEIEIVMKRRQYIEAIKLHHQLGQFRVLDHSNIGREISRAINKDKRDLDSAVRSFARQFS